MKLRLNLTTITKNEKEVSVKFNIAPSKHIGLLNFINIALKQGTPVEISFEKISKSGEREQSKIFGEFQLEGKKESEKILNEIKEKILDIDKHKKKIKQKKKKKI